MKKYLNKFLLIPIIALFLLGALGASTHYFGWFPAPMLQTGQTTSYHAGDDGATEYGVAKSYTTLDAGQYSGTTNIVINDKTRAASNICVQDNQTGRMWHREVIQADIGPATDGKFFWDEYAVTDTDISFVNATSKIHRAGGDWAVAPLCVGRRIIITGDSENNGTYNITAVDVNDITVAEALIEELAGDSVTVTTVDDLIWDVVDQANTNTLAGHDDWRVPTYYELLGLLNLENTGPCTDAATFPSTPATHHWSNNTDASDTERGYTIDFNKGITDRYNKETSKYYLRLVRGGI